MNSRIKYWLSSKHIIVPDDWLEACVDWIANENRTSVLGVDRINQLIYEQWLISDIKNIPSCCLPIGISAVQKEKLNGHFCLQIESLMDVGSPAYVQLEKVKGIENMNVSVTMKDSDQHNWEPKPTRMLLLQLTDGAQILQGMEYQPIPALNVNTHPGTKVLIYGSIDCRLGTLLLTNNNITILGGQVESLMQENSQLNLLTKMVYGSQDEPVSNNLSDVATSAANQNEPGSIPAVVQPSVSLEMQPNRSNHGSQFQAPVTLNYPSNQRIATSLPMVRSHETNFPSTVSNFKSEVKERSTMNHVYPTTNKLLNYSSEPFLSTSNEVDYNEMLNDDNDDVFANLNFDEIESLENHYEDLINIKDDWHDNTISNYKKQDNRTVPSNSLFTEHKITQILSSSYRDNAPFLNKSDQNSYSTSLLPKKHISPEFTYTNLQKTETVNQMSNFENYPITEVNCFSNNHTAAQNISNNSVFIPKRRKIESSVTIPYSEPLSYLSSYGSIDIVSNIIFVRAYITTIMSKLEFNNGKEWSLGVKLNDGSASIDVNIDNVYLQELIGFSASDVPRMKLLAQQNIEIKQHLQSGLQNCQQKLLNLCGILKIKLLPGKTPLVLTCIAETESTFNQHLTRINGLFEIYS